MLKDIAPYIIAEAGINHNGDLSTAKQLIQAAHDAGANCVKFQLFDPQNLVSKKAKKADYQVSLSQPNESQFDMLKKVAFTKNDHQALLTFSHAIGIDYLLSPFDLNSIKEIKELGLEMLKIPSGEITNTPYLIACAQSGLEIIMSTGMSTIDEVSKAVTLLYNNGVKPERLSLLQCNSAYPTPFKDVHLNVIQTYKDRFKLRVGFSDHTLGIEASIAAVALGASIIEKHLSLDTSLPGPDHKASILPSELKALVSATRNIALALGSSEKKPTPSEKNTRDVARKSIFSVRPIKKGELFTEHHLQTLRPGTGMSASHWFDILGKPSKRDYTAGEILDKKELIQRI